MKNWDLILVLEFYLDKLYSHTNDIWDIDGFDFQDFYITFVFCANSFPSFFLSFSDVLPPLTGSKNRRRESRGEGRVLT